MISVDSNSKVSIDKEFKSSLPPRRQDEAEDAAALVNKLYSEIAANKGEVPAPGSQPSQAPTIEAKKLVMQGIELASKDPRGNAAKAIELYDRALAVVQSRPLYESTQVTMMEVCNVLGPRCDAYMAVDNWAKAYADACMVLLLNPKDTQAYYRKGVCLYNGGKIDEAEIMLQYATMLAPQNAHYSDFLKKISSEKNKA